MSRAGYTFSEPDYEQAERMDAEERSIDESYEELRAASGSEAPAGNRFTVWEPAPTLSDERVAHFIECYSFLVSNPDRSLATPRALSDRDHLAAFQELQRARAARASSTPTGAA